MKPETEVQQLTESVTPAEIVAPDSTRGIYEEALAELQTSERDEAKEVIKRRLLEIRRMEACLEKAKADLAKMLNKDVSEIAMLPRATVFNI